MQYMIFSLVNGKGVIRNYKNALPFGERVSAARNLVIVPGTVRTVPYVERIPSIP